MSEENTSIVYALKPKPHRDGASAGENGYLAGVRSTGTYGNDDLIRDVAKATGQSEGLVRFIDTARREAIVAALKAGKRVYLDGVAFAVSVRGAFDTLDGGFDPKRNEVALTSYTYGGFHNCLEGIVPVNEVTGARPVLSVIREEGQEKEEILVTGRNVAITGKEIAITAGAADEGVALADIKSGEVVATAEIVSTTLIETVCTFAALPTNGRYRLEVRTRGGLGMEYKVATAGREVVVGTTGK